MKQAASFLFIVLGLVIFSSSEAWGVTFTNLHVFSTNDNSSVPGGGYGTNSDGVNPASLVISGNTVYGTAVYGGQYGYGTVFRMDTDGTHFTNLFNFNQGSADPHTGRWTNNTGSEPNPGLVLISNTLYGTTFYGGPVLAGSVFKINTDGSGFGILHEFDQVDGYTPYNGLVLHSNLLYGTTVSAGTYGYGNIFTVDPNGGGTSFIYQFTNMVSPYGSVAFDSSGGIYGFGRFGLSQKGLVYKVAGGYSILYTFTGTDGQWPVSTPVVSSNTIFGVTSVGGINGSGNVFRINTDGSAFTNIYSFSPNDGANRDGVIANDYTGLMLSGNTLYGTAQGGGSGGQGTVWQVNTDGSGFQTLHSFKFTDGGNPENVVLANGTLYGVTYWGFYGVSVGVGGVFAITLQPTLNITGLTNRVVLTWNDSSFLLYTSTNISGTYTYIPLAHSPYTNTISGQRYFRLQSP
jgi:uncharacterized repeat protein (TIGR03803 family)